MSEVYMQKKIIKSIARRDFLYTPFLDNFFDAEKCIKYIYFTKQKWIKIFFQTCSSL